MTQSKDELYKVHMSWIEACESSDKLTEWEEGFIVSIKGQLERKGSLSRDQVITLENIYTNKTD